MNNRGVLLIDLLVGLMIFCALSLIALSNLHMLTRTYLRDAIEERGRLNIGIAVSWIRKSSSAAAAPLPLAAPRIGYRGAVLQADGQQHPVMSATKGIRPAQTSDTITFLVPEKFSAVRVISAENSAEVMVCSDAASASITNTNHWLGVCADRYVELEGELRRYSASATVCAGEKTYTGALAIKTRPMFFPAPQDLSLSQMPACVHALLGIADVFTLYVDDDGTLRYLSHSKTDNQPIASGISRLEASPQESGILLRVFSQSPEQSSLEILLPAFNKDRLIPPALFLL